MRFERAGLRAVLVVLVCTSILVGCSPPEPLSLTSHEQLAIAEFQDDVTNFTSDGSHHKLLLASTDKVIAIARSKPEAVYKAEGQPVREVLATAASQLAGSDPALAKKLDLTVQALARKK